MANIESIKKDNPTKIPDTYVHGKVYLSSSPVEGATVKLYKGTKYLTQTTSGSDGGYRICICCQHQGYGDYKVKATYIDKWDNTYNDSENFTWTYGTWDYKIDLILQAYK